MDIKHARPDFVSNFVKPKNTEIKHINGHWYLYERTTKYNPETGKSRKVSGRMLGSITEQGFVEKRIASSSHTRHIEVVELGASQYFYEQEALMREKLKEFFPDSWREIFSLAVITLVYERTLQRGETHYETSILSALLPHLTLSPTRLLERLGKDRMNIRAFMRSMPSEGNRFIVVDAKRLIPTSQNNLLYIFSCARGFAHPEYYMQCEGTIGDVTAFKALIKEAEIDEKSCIFITEKGFGSEENFDLVDASILHYMTPLKRGNQDVRGQVPASQFDYEHGFLYHKRPVFSKRIDCEGYAVHLFLDPSLLTEESASTITSLAKKNATMELQKEKELGRRENSKGRLTDEELAALQSCTLFEEVSLKAEMGTIAIRTNKLDLTSLEIYGIYMQGQAIGQFFKTFDYALDSSASYMRANHAMEGWLFLNHLSMMMGIKAINAIALKGKSEEISLDDFIQGMSKIQATKIDGKWYPAQAPKKVSAMCSLLEIELSPIEDYIQQEKQAVP